MTRRLMVSETGGYLTASQ